MNRIFLPCDIWQHLIKRKIYNYEWFSYFINYEKENENEKKEEKKIIVKNSPNSEWNGEYVEGEVNWKDNGSIS